jgi:hypothetical protein
VLSDVRELAIALTACLELFQCILGGQRSCFLRTSWRVPARRPSRSSQLLPEAEGPGLCQLVPRVGANREEKHSLAAFQLGTAFQNVSPVLSKRIDWLNLYSGIAHSDLNL